MTPLSDESMARLRAALGEALQRREDQFHPNGDPVGPDTAVWLLAQPRVAAALKELAEGEGHE